MPADRFEILHDLNRAFNGGGDWSRFYADDAEVHMPPEWPEERVYRGIDGIGKALDSWQEGFDEYHWVEERLVEAPGDRVVGLYYQRGRIKGAGTPIEQAIGIVFGFRGAKLAGFDGYFSWEEALRAAGVDRDAAAHRRAAPPGIHTITPHIVVPDAAEAAEWYSRVLGATEISRLTLPDGRVMTLELRFGDSAVMVAGEFPEAGVLAPRSVGGTACVLQLYAADVDALWERATGHGAEVRHPISDTFWGDRHGQIVDPFGHRWNLARHDRDVPHDEQERAAAAAFGFEDD